MTAMDNLPPLLPCPFCGNTDVEVKDNGRMWHGSGWTEPVSVSILHHCPAEPGQPHRGIERIGRDRESAVAAWNKRAGLAAKPTMDNLPPLFAEPEPIHPVAQPKEQ